MSDPVDLRPICIVCRGNDYEMPCAFPSHNFPGCLKYLKIELRKIALQELDNAIRQVVEITFGPDPVVPPKVDLPKGG